MSTTRAVIYKQNLRHNLQEIKKRLEPSVKMCVAVKADGYGHGSVLTSRIAVEEGAEFLAVARVEEGIELREAGITARILLLSLCEPADFTKLLEYDITPFVFGAEHIKALDDAIGTKLANQFTDNKSNSPVGNTIFGLETAPEENQHNASNPAGGLANAPTTVGGESQSRFPIHLAIDTGMGRIGCLPSEASTQAKLISESRHLKLEGVGTHFAVSDSISPENIEFTKHQFESFTQAIESIKAIGINPGIRHAAASAAILTHPEYHLDMVRPGIITYGYYPDEITREYLAAAGKEITLKPVMQFETKVSAIRHFTKGQSVSYGRTWTAEEDTDIAVLPVGYADGLLRRFSPGLNVTINGKQYPVVGRICMDQCMVDLGKDSGVKVWDTVVIFGTKLATPEENQLNASNQTDRLEIQSADELAKIGDTISYEILTTIGKRVPRVEI